MIRLALPTGDLRAQTADMLDSAGERIEGYASGSRMLRFPILDGTGVARVFREKDIPVQVALGNYDIGICGLSWVEELTARFPRHDIVRLRALGYGSQPLWLATAGDTAHPSVRIVSEFGNIADTLARRLRLRRYRVFSVWGAAEKYPPEDADVAILAAADGPAVEALGLRPLCKVLESSAWLIANRKSLAAKDLSRLLPRLLAAGAGNDAPEIAVPRGLGLVECSEPARSRSLRIALPDGHAQSHTLEALRMGGISVSGYGDGAAGRRAKIDVEGVEVKVIRPQDMPQQVAIGQFDLAITGRDVLFNHLVQFPSSPVEVVVDLGRSRYSLAAIVKDVQADTVSGAVAEWRARSDAPIRLASEFPNIADHFARERHFGRYSVIPIAGASEGFVPDDAEILIEGIETGSSVRANNLTVLERFFESTNCVIANKERPTGKRGELFDTLVTRLRAGAAEPAMAAGA